MKCMICGKDYIALGVHVKLKHQMDVGEYKEEFGMLKTQSLVDADLHHHMSKMAKNRIALDPEWKQEITQRMLKYVGKTNFGCMSKAGRERLAQMNKKNALKYLKSKEEIVSNILKNGGTMLDVRRKTGMGDKAAKKINLMAMSGYTSEAGRKERAKRAANVLRTKAINRIAKIKHLYDESESIADFCRKANITRKTYYNWVNAGLIGKHKRSRIV